MLYPQVVVYESEGSLAAQVAEVAREHRWVVRETRRPENCLNLLREGRSTVLLLKLERRLIDELSLLAKVVEESPDTAVVVISDVKLDSATALAGLAYDLGARYVLFPPLLGSTIEDLTIGLLQSAIERAGGRADA